MLLSLSFTSYLIHYQQNMLLFEATLPMRMKIIVTQTKNESVKLTTGYMRISTSSSSVGYLTCPFSTETVQSETKFTHKLSAV
jgi:hypothetical protein